jgi:hypothetical protein
MIADRLKELHQRRLAIHQEINLAIEEKRYDDGLSLVIEFVDLRSNIRAIEKEHGWSP